MKKCKTCGEEKEDHEFRTSVNKTTGREYLRRHCRVCTNKKNRQNQRQNDRQSNLQSKYAITEAEYEMILKSQNGVCAICGQSETTKFHDNIIKLAVDHCHKTCKIRGLLCINCNHMLGKAKDAPELLEKAAVYLRKYQ